MIDTGSHGAAIESLQRSINKRLRARSAANRVVEVDGQFGNKTRHAMAYAAYLLGAEKTIVDGMLHGTINAEEVRFVRNPGRRNQNQIDRGKKRVAAHRAAVAKAQAAANEATTKVRKLIAEAEKAAANYRKNPTAYHYLAGGVPNLIYLSPSPTSYRSDCSQFVAALYKAADLPSPASVPHIWASTWTMVKTPGVMVVDRAHRKPGMLGMYGSQTAPHHVELFCGDKFIGHGSPPIDSLTPGEPDYYLDFPFLHGEPRSVSMEADPTATDGTPDEPPVEGLTPPPGYEPQVSLSPGQVPGLVEREPDLITDAESELDDVDPDDGNADDADDLDENGDDN